MGARKLPVSVFVIARNEADRIGRTLDAVSWADQIVVVDSGSTDDTVAIAEAHGAEVTFREWEGYGPQKRFAESLCRHPWLLNVDADEVVTPELAREIEGIVAGGAAPGAFRVRILNVYPGDDRPRWLANDYNVVRFYHAEAGSYRDHALFDRVELAEGIDPKRLRGPIHHYPFLSLHAWLEKENAYTTFQAGRARRRNRFALLLRLPFEAPLVFLKTYFLRLHITGGWKGFVFALTVGFVRMLRLAKMLERADLEGAEKK